MRVAVGRTIVEATPPQMTSYRGTSVESCTLPPREETRFLLVVDEHNKYSCAAQEGGESLFVLGRTEDVKVFIRNSEVYMARAHFAPCFRRLVMHHVG